MKSFYPDFFNEAKIKLQNVSLDVRFSYRGESRHVTFDDYILVPHKGHRVFAYDINKNGLRSFYVKEMSNIVISVWPENEKPDYYFIEDNDVSWVELLKKVSETRSNNSVIFLETICNENKDNMICFMEL